MVEPAAHGEAALGVGAAQRRVVERTPDLLGEHAHELFISLAEVAVALVQHLQHAADLIAPHDRRRQHRRHPIPDLLRDRLGPPRIGARVADVDELAALRDVSDHARPRRYAQLRHLRQRRDARANLSGRAVDQPQRGSIGAERTCDARGERRQQVIELDLPGDHRAEVGQQLEPLVVLAHLVEHRTNGHHAAAALSASFAYRTSPSRAATVPGSAARAAASSASSCASVRIGS